MPKVMVCPAHRVMKCICDDVPSWMVCPVEWCAQCDGVPCVMVCPV